MNVAIELDAVRMLLVKVTARLMAQEPDKAAAIETLLNVGERDIGRMEWVGLSDADASKTREAVKAAFAALVDAAALGNRE
jgi:hypothetical protein